MTILIAVLSGVQALAFAGGGVAKLAGIPAMRNDAQRLSFSYSMFRAVGLLELAGAAGLIAGLFYHPLGIAAAAGLAVLTAGAVVSHIRAKDPAPKIAGPALFCALSITTIILHLSA